VKAIVCYSGGHSSALVAIEAVRKCGRENVILLNHDISPKVEREDIKRFKNEVAEYLGMEITYANAPDFEEMTPLAVSVKKNAFQVGNGQCFCTHYLKTEPFHTWLAENYPADINNINEDVRILYGFDRNEPHRIQRREGVLLLKGYKSDFPLAFWKRTIDNTEEIGIRIPSTYRIWKHANCQACLKAGKQHWYCVFCLRPDLWAEGKQAESEIGYSIIKGSFLEELEPKFMEMRDKQGICPTEKGKSASFWKRVNDTLPEQISFMPCDCAI